MSLRAPAPLDGRYTILGPLGEGGFATVWRALDTRLGAECALKRVALDAGVDVATALEEARVLAQLRHPNIVTVLDAFTDEDGVVIVMELARGSVADWMRMHGAAPPRAVAEVVEGIADALATAHTRDIVHRDVKPQNVLVFAGGRTKLGDFGVARQLASGRGMTRTSAIKGTIAFMAPEQRNGAERADTPADVYALGLTALTLATGSVPREPYMPPEAARLRALLPANLAEPLLLACAWEPGDRPTMENLRSAMRAALLELPAGPGAELLQDVEPAADSEVEAVHTSAPLAPRSASVAPLPRANVPRTSATRLVAGALLVAGLSWAGARVWPSRVEGTREGVVDGAVATLPTCPDAPSTWQEQRKLGPRETVSSRAVDADGDGHLDLLFANQLDETVTVYFLDGTARLPKGLEVPAGRVGPAPLAGDVDDDGRPDLVLLSRDSAEVRVLPGKADRTFASYEEDMQAGTPSWGDLWDWDGDGHRDLLVQLSDCLAWRRGLGGAAGLNPTAAVRSRRLFSAPHECLDMGAKVWSSLVDLDGVGAGVATLVGDRLDLVRPGKGGWAGARTTLLEHLPERAQLFTRTRRDGRADALYLRREDALLQLDGKGGFACEVKAPSEVAGLADLDADGILDGYGSRTCAMCTSNHLLLKGQR